MNQKFVYIKFGGAVITNKTWSTPKLIEEILRPLIQVVSQHAEKSILLAHGAGSFGHNIVREYNLQNGCNKETVGAVTKVQQSMIRMNHLFCNICTEFNLPVYPIHLSSTIIKNESGFVNVPIKVIQHAIYNTMVPVMYGTLIPDTMQGCRVLSADDIPLLLDGHLEKVIHVTDVEGVYDSDPKINPAAKIQAVITPADWKSQNYSDSDADVTGGMRAKVEKCLKLSCTSIIISGKNSQNLQKALAGEPVGTKIQPGN